MTDFVLAALLLGAVAAFCVGCCFAASQRTRLPRARRLFAAVGWVSLLFLVGGLSLWMWQLRQPECAFHALFKVKVDTFCVVLCLIGCAHSLLFCNWRRRVIGMATVVGLAYGTSLAVRGNVPLRLAFSASKSELDQVAERVRAEPAAPFRGRAGAYDIVTTRVVSVGVILSLTDLDKSGDWPYGFVRTVGGQTPTPTSLGLDGVGVEKLTGDWYVYYDRYWSVKVGWS